MKLANVLPLGDVAVCRFISWTIMMTLAYWTRPPSLTQLVTTSHYSLLVSHRVRCLSCLGEVWDIAACPADSNMVATVFSSVSIEGISGGVGVWRMEGEGGEGEGGTLEEVCQLSHDGMPRW